MTDVQAETVYGAWWALITVFGSPERSSTTPAWPPASGKGPVFLMNPLKSSWRASWSRCPLATASAYLSSPLANGGTPRRRTGDSRSGCTLVDALTTHYSRGKDEICYGHCGGDSFDVDGGDAIVASVDNDDDDDDDDVNDRGLARDDASSTPSSSSAWAMTANHAITLSGVFANLTAVLIAIIVRKIKVGDSSGGSSTTTMTTRGSFELQRRRRRWHGMPRRRCGRRRQRAFPIRGSSFQILSDTIRTPNFRRFHLVCLLTINVRMVFRRL